MVAVTCLVILPLMAALAWSANRTRLERGAEITEQAHVIASTAATSLDQFFSSLDAMASVLVPVAKPSLIALIS